MTRRWLSDVLPRSDYSVYLTFVLRAGAAALAYLIFALIGHNSSLRTFTEFALIFSVVGFCGPLSPIGQQMTAFKYLPPLFTIRSPWTWSLFIAQLRLLAMTAPVCALGGVIFLWHSLGTLPGILVFGVAGAIVLTGLAEYLFAVTCAVGWTLWSIFAREIVWRCAFIVAVAAFLAFHVALSTTYLTSTLCLTTLIGTSALAIPIFAVFSRLRSRDGPSQTSERPKTEFTVFFGITVLNVALIQIDPLILGAVSVTPEIAAYFVAQRIIQLLSFFSYAFSINLVGAVSVHFSHREMEEIGGLSRKVSRRAGFIVLTAGVLMNLFAADLMGLFRPELRGYAVLLPLLSIGPVVYAFSGLQANVATLCGLEAEYLIWRSVSAVCFTLAKIAAAIAGHVLVFALLSSSEICVISAIGVALARIRYGVWLL